MSNNKNQETKTLNQQSASKKGTSGAGNMTNSVSTNSDLEEAKKLNKQSHNKKGSK